MKPVSLIGILGLVAFSAYGYAFTLTTECPTGFYKTEKGRCAYEVRYLREKALTGLQKPFAVPKPELDPKRIHLGKLLFFDPILSGDGSMSCASCHSPELSLSDGRAQSVARGNTLTRSAPSLWNVAFQPRFFWDSRANTLEAQASGPLFAADEMANTPLRLERSLNANETYRRLFAEAFGLKGRITTIQVTEALSDFQRTLISFNSRYDRYVYGDTDALTKEEERGLTLFRSFVTRCTECHTPPLFTNFESAIIGAPEPGSKTFDEGIGHIAQEPRLNGAFKIPTLRNIAKTAPFMHSGVFANLGDVVHFYNLGGGRGPLGVPSRFTHWHIGPIRLSVVEEKEIVSFLGSLTDESCLPGRPERVPSGIAFTH